MSHQDSEKNKRLHETIESLARPDEQARELARLFLGAHEATMDSYQQKAFEEGVALVAALLAKARLDEAKWWHDEIEGTVICRDDKPCSYCQRIASLRAAAAQPGDTADGGER